MQITKGRLSVAATSNKVTSAVVTDALSGCVSVTTAVTLMKLCEPGSIDKVRYLVKSGSHTFEVDEFHGENEGLVMAEVELQSEEESYEKPDFIGQEVTGDRRYYNAYLTKCPFTSWPENKSADR